MTVICKGHVIGYKFEVYAHTVVCNVAQIKSRFRMSRAGTCYDLAE